jgi:hypothetical protein
VSQRTGVDANEYSHRVSWPTQADTVQVVLPAQRSAAARLDEVADLLEEYARRVTGDCGLTAPGSDPVSLQSARVLKASIGQQLAAVRSGVTGFRHLANNVRDQADRYERNEQLTGDGFAGRMS